MHNLGTNDNAAVLTGTDSDKRTPFIANAQGNPQQPADPRYSFATEQYYAAASYGPLQVGLDFWYGPSGQQFVSAFDVSQNQIWNLSSQWGVAVDLGGKVHSLTIAAAQKGQVLVPLCGVYGNNSCNAKSWSNMWFAILKSNNGAGDAAKA